MDALAQAAAFLQPSFEFVVKLSSAIPVWMALVMADKHFLGIPLLEGSLWRSPRIPPPFAVRAIRGRKQGSLPKIGRHSAPSGPSEIEHRPFESAKTSSTQSLQGSLLSLGASSTTALSVSRPLEVEDLFIHQSSWLEPNRVTSMILFFLLFAFFGMLVKGAWSPLGRSQAPIDPERRLPEPFPGSSIADDMEFQKFWDSMLGEQGIREMQEGIKVQEERGQEERGQDEKGQEGNGREGKGQDENGKEEETTQEEENGQKDKIKEIGMDATVDMTKGKKKESEAAEEDGKENWEGKAKAGIEEDEWIDIHDNAENAGLNGSPVMGKKKRFRQNAKRRAAAKKATVGEEWEDEPVVSGMLAMAKDDGKDKVTAQVPKIAGKGEASLPPGRPAPQAKKKRAPVGLPPKPQVTGLRTTKSSGNPQSPPGATANASPCAGSIPPPPKKPTRCKGSVRPATSYSILPVPTMAIDYTKKKNFELETLLKARSLPHTGKKALLIARLQKYDAEKFEGESDWEDEGAMVESANTTAIVAGGSDQLTKPTAMPKQVVTSDPSKAKVLTNASKAAEADKGKTGAAIAQPGPQRSIFQNVPTVSGPFTGFGQPSAGAVDARPSHQRSILQNVPTVSGPFTGFGQPSADPTDAGPIIKEPMFRRKASLPAPVPLSIKGQSGGIPLQDAVSAAMKHATGDKMEGKKPTIGFRGSSFEPWPMPKR